MASAQWRQLNDAAWRARRGGDLVEAERLLREALVEAARGGPADLDWPQTLNSLGDLLRSVGRLDDAERCARDGLAMRRATDPEGVLVGNDLMFLSQIVEAQGRRAEARALAAEAVPIYRRALGSDHREVRYMESVLARLSVG